MSGTKPPSKGTFNLSSSTPWSWNKHNKPNKPPQKDVNEMKRSWNWTPPPSISNATSTDNPFLMMQSSFNDCKLSSVSQSNEMILQQMHYERTHPASHSNESNQNREMAWRESNQYRESNQNRYFKPKTKPKTAKDVAFNVRQKRKKQRKKRVHRPPTVHVKGDYIYNYKPSYYLMTRTISAGDHAECKKCGKSIPVTCKKDGKVYGNKTSWQRHLLSCDTKQIICPKCKEGFKPENFEAFIVHLACHKVHGKKSKTRKVSMRSDTEDSDTSDSDTEDSTEHSTDSDTDDNHNGNGNGKGVTVVSDSD
eukprot:259463_1